MFADRRVCAACNMLSTIVLFGNDGLVWVICNGPPSVELQEEGEVALPLEVDVGHG